MANGYYTPTDIVAGSKARSAVLDANFDAVEVGFDQLPTEANIKEGKINYAVDTGAADAYVVSLPHAPSSYSDGLLVEFKIGAGNDNTGACTIDVNSLGAVAIKDHAGSDPAADALPAGAVIRLRHNGTNFRIVGASPGDAAAAAASAAAAATSETNAATSESNAATSATNAASSATSASTAQTAAEAAQTAAETAQTGAETAETNAGTSETNAATSETNAATSATNAATSETNAATSETNAATSATEAAEDRAVTALRYTFDTSTSMADPGTGDIRFNNATMASVTAMAVDALAADTGNPDVSDYIATWDDSSSTVKGQLVFRKVGDASYVAVFDITAVTDNTGWLQLTVSHVLGSTLPSGSDELAISFYRVGDKGEQGPGSGDLLAANNLSDVDNAATAFSNIKQAASTTATGVSELATDAEAQAKVSTSRVLTASNLAALDSSATFAGLVELATTSEATTGTDTARAVTAAGVQAALNGGAITRTAAVNLADQTLERPFIEDYALTVVAKGSLGATPAFDYSAGNIQTGTLDQNVTSSSVTNWPATGRYGRIELIITQDASAAKTVTWPGAVIWSDGEEPDLSTLSSVTHVVLTTLDAGTTIYGYRAGGNFA